MSLLIKPTSISIPHHPVNESMNESTCVGSTHRKRDGNDR